MCHSRLPQFANPIDLFDELSARYLGGAYAVLTLRCRRGMLVRVVEWISEQVYIRSLQSTKDLGL